MKLAANFFCTECEILDSDLEMYEIKQVSWGSDKK